MNCPRCNSPNPEDKKYCADCGAPFNLEARHLETYVQSQVQEAIEKKFKDQKFVELETSQAIVDRLHGWAKAFGFFVGIPFAVLLLLLAVAGIEKYSDFKNLVNDVERRVRPQVEQAKANAEQAQSLANEAKTKAEAAKATTETVVAQVNKQLGSATEIVKSVQSLSGRVSELEKQTSGQMRASTQRVESRVSELDQKIDAASRDIVEQQKKLASTDELVKTLFSKGTTEYFPTTVTTSNAVIVPRAKGAVVFMLLKSAPIYQTIEVKWHVYSQPRGSYTLINNILLFVWDDPADNLKQYPLEVTYVPDPTSKNPAYKALTVKSNSLFADEQKIMDLPH
jgi:F0F1-type ATP synthase membrane subunit b/b'